MSQSRPLVTPLAEFDARAGLSCWTRQRGIEAGVLPWPFRINGRAKGYSTAEASILFAAIASGLTRNELRAVTAEIQRAREERRQGIIAFGNVGVWKDTGNGYAV